MASSTTNEKTTQKTENIYLPKLSSDNNANPNNVKSTGAIPKIKINPIAKNIPNGIIGPEGRLKVNNNLHDTNSTNCKSELNGTCTSTEKQFGKKTANNYNFKSATNGMNQLSDEDCVCRLQDEVPVNGIDAPEPSTSGGLNNIQMSVHREQKDTESECSSDTGNDDLSCSDDCCIYTYKGDVADLPSSFMNLDIPDNNEAQGQSRAGSRGSSPEMDFLEMDFDPGPSCDADSDESSITSDLKSNENIPEDVNNCPDDKESPVLTISSETEPEEICEENNIKIERNDLSQENSIQSVKMESESLHNVLTDERKVDEKDTALRVNLTNEPWIPKLSIHRTTCSSLLRESKGHHTSSGDLISPNENILPCTSSSLDCRINTSSSLYHSTMEKQLVLDKPPTTTNNEEFVSAVEKTMIWTEQEAALKQVTQIGTSACGATAVINVLLALNHPIPTNERLLECVTTRLRQNNSPLVEYLKSRSTAGSTHLDIINGLTKISDGKIYSRFFHMHPERYLNLTQWLSYWIKKGAVPIATINLQKGVKPENPIPDAWHHQMLFGVGPHGIYLTNPLERVEEGVLWHQLSSESVLLVKREDVLSRWNNKTNLRDLIDLCINDVRWHRLNVVGQVANVIREHYNKLASSHAVSRTHITIPAEYSAGIILAINVENPACELLKHCPELPILNALP